MVNPRLFFYMDGPCDRHRSRDAEQSGPASFRSCERKQRFGFVCLPVVNAQRVVISWETAKIPSKTEVKCDGALRVQHAAYFLFRVSV